MKAWEIRRRIPSWKVIMLQNSDRSDQRSNQNSPLHHGPVCLSYVAKKENKNSWQTFNNRDLTQKLLRKIKVLPGLIKCRENSCSLYLRGRQQSRPIHLFPPYGQGDGIATAISGTFKLQCDKLWRSERVARPRGGGGDTRYKKRRGAVTGSFKKHP